MTLSTTQASSTQLSHARPVRVGALTCFLVLATAACKREESPPAAHEASSPVGAEVKSPPAEKAGDDSKVPIARGTTLPPQKILEVVNPKQRPPYDGPTGRVKGHVAVVGDPPIELEEALATIPASCGAAREAFRYAYREGMQRSLADALVAVTGYSGYVPPVADAVTLEASGCAWRTRTIALTFGQRIDVVSKDKNTYMPELLGEGWPVQLAATPSGDPVAVSPRKVGHYVLIDSLRLFNAADVYVVPYSTVAVTGLDGTFELDRIPPGPVKVNALLPVTGATVEKEVTVEAGKTVTVNLELAFDPKVFEQKAAERAAALDTKAEAKPQAIPPAGTAPAAP